MHRRQLVYPALALLALGILLGLLLMGMLAR